VDTGLLISMYNDLSIYSQIMDDELKVKKGGIYENFIANQLISLNYELMYYHKNFNEKNNDIEIDFCISKNGNFLPIEIKSGRNFSYSMKKILEDKNIEFGIKAGNFNIGYSDKLLTIPIYMLIFLNRDIPKFLFI
jgi:predicted AAA+ superfamily ATPase